MRAILESPESIETGHGRYFFKCSGNSEQSYPYNGAVSVPCAPFWLTLKEKAEYDRLGRYCGRRPIEMPLRCACGAWCRLIHRLEVDAYANECRQEGRTRHTCENTCQVSESKKCRCACGGRRHGIALREADGFYLA